jgi:hypothetical protein
MAGGDFPIGVHGVNTHVLKALGLS